MSVAEIEADASRCQPPKNRSFPPFLRECCQARPIRSRLRSRSEGFGRGRARPARQTKRPSCGGSGNRELPEQGNGRKPRRSAFRALRRQRPDRAGRRPLRGRSPRRRAPALANGVRSGGGFAASGGSARRLHRPGLRSAGSSPEAPERLRSGSAAPRPAASATPSPTTGGGFRSGPPCPAGSGRSVRAGRIAAKDPERDEKAHFLLLRGSPAAAKSGYAPQQGHSGGNAYAVTSTSPHAVAARSRPCNVLLRHPCSA